MTNINKYRSEIKALCDEGSCLMNSIQYHCFKEEFIKQAEQTIKDDNIRKNVLENLPDFHAKYEIWYSKAIAVIKFLLPDRLEDFKRKYHRSKIRKSVTSDEYVIEDFLNNLIVREERYNSIKVNKSAAIPKFRQQLSILEACIDRLDSSLFDIKQLIQADLFDSELEAAKELNKKGFMRAAGALAGVVLESHFSQVCETHKIKMTKRNPSIGDYNEILKVNDIVDIATFRFIQHLGDLRNKCSHKKEEDPTKIDINDLINGTDKIIKSVF